MIGVLDLQGDVVEHIDHLERLGITAIRVKKPADFEQLAGLIIPGGESTCLARLLNILGIRDSILRGFQRGLKLWGTCAGAILLANEIVGETPVLALIDIEIQRNAFGSQLDSFVSEAMVPCVAQQPIPLTFIRAPKITRVGTDVVALLRQDDYIVAAESSDVLVTVFHPELTPSLAFHRYFALKCGLNPSVNEEFVMIDHTWDGRSWTRFTRL
ncbi:MAG: pyridoxal 5'-phosphate synthase glutaminase subunit PdxT [Thermodesulfobacteriota bacterium]|nr:pyridoxal 5'-phosphate synthase glutaminase subunit PdxT [Thermodesulfobacteriota bacterium]